MGGVELLNGLARVRTLSLFGTERSAPRRAFARFVAERVGHGVEPEVQAPCFLGDENFVCRVVAQAERVVAQAEPVSAEVPRRQRPAPSIAQIEAGSASRNDAIRRAYSTGVYALGEIGAYFGLHYATISRLVRRPQGE